MDCGVHVEAEANSDKNESVFNPVWSSASFGFCETLPLINEQKL